MRRMVTQGHARDARAKNEHFFQVYKNLEGHEVKTDGFEGRSEAISVIDEAFQRAEAEGR